MSHLFESGFFVGKPAWHKLGVLLAGAPTIEQAIVAAELNKQVRHEPMTVTMPDGSVFTVPDHVAVMREDGKHLGVVGSGTEILQADTAFEQFRPLVDSGEITLEAAGALAEGRRIWILGAVKDGLADVNPGDPIKQYVLLAHAHDGSLSIRFGFTCVRVVCQNTLSMAVRGSSAAKMAKVKHTKNMHNKLDQTRASLDFARQQIRATAEHGRYLASKGIDQKNLVRYVREVLSPGSADTTDTVRNQDAVLEAFEKAPGQDLPGTRGTLWGAYNAVTYYATHERGRSRDTNLNSQWFGTGGQLADRALEVATAFAKDAPEAGWLAAQNTALASASFAELLGGTVAPKPDTSAGDAFASLLDRPASI